MRNPDRIDAILHKIRRVRTAYPDMRLGQLLEVIKSTDKCDMFSIEDSKLETHIDRFIIESKILDL